MASSSPPRVGFVLEQALGHVSHAQNLKQLLPHEPAINAAIVEVDWATHGWPSRVPVFNSNWTVRAGLRARRGIRHLRQGSHLDGLFIHTQVPAVLSPDWLARIPTVVSIDATPLQYDELGEHYDHHSGHPRVEHLKWRASRLSFTRAAHLVSWSQWAKQGLVDGYGIDERKVTVIPPGVTTSTWARSSDRGDHAGPVRILFVGGDLERKGGDVLLAAFRQPRAVRGGGRPEPEMELDLVTSATIPEEPGVTVHRGLRPASPELVRLYQRADIFCLPTRGDCLPMVLPEAGAAGLPLVSTAVAAIPELVRDGETGLVVAPDDSGALARALATLVDAPDLRGQLGASARRLVEQDHDAVKNTRRLCELLAAVATEGAAAA